MLINCKFFPSCGGCDFLDFKQDEYRKIKQENLEKILQIKPQYFWIKPNSRRRINLQIGSKNEVGFFQKSSKNIVEIDQCLSSESDISKLILPIKNLLKNFENNLITKIQITLFDNILDVVFFIKREFNFAQNQKIIEFAKVNKINASYKLQNEIIPILFLQNNQISINDKILNLTSDVFIQATKEGLEIIIDKIQEFIAQNFLETKPKIVDIYSGFGIYSFAISDKAKEIKAFEGSKNMVELIIKNAAKNQEKIYGNNRDLFFSPISAVELKNFDLAIINPPRIGALPQVKEIAKSNLKNLIYVSCNPKTFIFDAKFLTENNFKIEKIFAIDQFFGTNHFELVVFFKR